MRIIADNLSLKKLENLAIFRSGRDNSEVSVQDEPQVPGRQVREVSNTMQFNYKSGHSFQFAMMFSYQRVSSGCLKIPARSVNLL